MLETTQEIILFIVIMAVLIIGIISVSLLNASIQKQIKNDLTAWEKKYHRPIYEKQISDLNDEITCLKTDLRLLKAQLNTIREYVFPIVKERVDNKRKNALKSFNKWKMINVHEEEQCAECFGANIELQTENSETNFYNEKSFPIKAMNKCNDCGHIISEWKFEGRD